MCVFLIMSTYRLFESITDNAGLFHFGELVSWVRRNQEGQNLSEVI